MLTLIIPPQELFDEETYNFITTKEYKLLLEHSLISLSKWESKWKKPFLKKGEKPREEIIDYIRCMTINTNVDPECYDYLTEDAIQTVLNYLNDSMTATTFSGSSGPPSREKITSELVYYWMIANNIPFECEKWHINRLLTLIRICGIKNSPAKKMSRQEALNQQRSLNAARKAKMHTHG